jgi:hypothetical protein
MDMHGGQVIAKPASRFGKEVQQNGGIEPAGISNAQPASGRQMAADASGYPIRRIAP